MVNPETGGQEHGLVLIAFFKAAVLSGAVKVGSADDNGPLHLHLSHHTTQNPPSDRDITSKREFLVNVGALCSPLGHLEAQTNVFCSIVGTSPCQFLQARLCSCLKDGCLLLVDMLTLNVCHLPSGLRKGREILTIKNSTKCFLFC